MPRWAIALTVAPLVICLGCGVIAYLVVWRGVEEAVPKVRNNVSTTMADALSGNVSRRIEARARAMGDIGAVDEIVLRPSDLSVNTDLVPGEVGIQTGTDGTSIYGVETRISPGGITLLLPGATYSGLPILVDGRIELAQISNSGDMIRFLFPDEVFKEAVEGGINDAFRDHGLTPVSLVLGSGVMTIEVEPIPCSGGASRIGGCNQATPFRNASR